MQQVSLVVQDMILMKPESESEATSGSFLVLSAAIENIAVPARLIWVTRYSERESAAEFVQLDHCY